ncbi:MAG: methionine--tRNA ligase subunit beta [Candidatus Hydrothermarchaeales archaeon]
MEKMGVEDFKRLDLRVGEIIDVEEIEGSDNLFRITVDIGEERQLVVGIKPWYFPEDLKSKKVIVMANLQPVEVFGVESQGVLLTAEDGRTISLLTIDKDVEKGTKIR